MRLSLMHKGFMLVSVPLFFELAIFSVLLAQQNEMAQESARINKARMIGDAANRISRRIIMLDDSFRMSSNPLIVARLITEGIDDLYAQFHILDNLTQNNPTFHTMVLKALLQLDGAKVDLERLKVELSQSGRIPLEEARRFAPMFHYRIRAAASSGLLEMAATSAKEIDTDRTAAIRQNQTTLLKFGVGLSALIAAIGTWLFSHHMISRLKVVVSNADNLGARKPLSAPVGGSDEIGELDLAVHNAANLISSLDQAREEIIGMVSHDIRSPLATIKATGELLKDRFQENLDKRGNELIDIIDNNCDRVLRISKDLLDMQRLESGMLTLDKSSTNLKECLLSAASSTEGLQQKYGVEVVPALESLHANVDEGRLEQIVINLLTNAIKYSPRGGKVILTLGFSVDQNFIRISVIDNGEGIPDSMKETIFDRYKQINKEDSKTGSGLGLAISRALVELHGGKIGVSNVSPKGSEFWILLPKAESVS